MFVLSVISADHCWSHDRHKNGQTFHRLVLCRRWIKFEEDVEEGGERWSKPHVATLSLHSLFELRCSLLQGTCMLEVEANSIEQIAGEWYLYRNFFALSPLCSSLPASSFQLHYLQLLILTLSNRSSSLICSVLCQLWMFPCLPILCSAFSVSSYIFIFCAVSALDLCISYCSVSVPLHNSINAELDQILCMLFLQDLSVTSNFYLLHVRCRKSKCGFFVLQWVDQRSRLLVNYTIMV